jgi:hypothetical protein
MPMRQDYLSGEVSHEDYYADVMAGVRVRIDADMARRILAATDPFFNDVPLSLWDGLAARHRSGVALRLAARGDFYTQAEVSP